MPAASTPTWSPPRARWRRIIERGERVWASTWMSRCRKSRSRAKINGVLVWQFDRRKLARVGGALNYGRATVRCIWRAGGWLVFSYPDDGPLRRAGQSGAERLDGRGRLRQSAARRRLDRPTTARRWTQHSRDVGSGNRAFFRDAQQSGDRDRRAPTRHQCHCARRARRCAGGSAPAGARVLGHRADGSVSAAAHSGALRAGRTCGGGDTPGAASARSHPARPGHPCRDGAPGPWPACACWISPGRWSARSPPRSSVISAPMSSRSKAARDPVCRGSTCRSASKPAISTTSPGSRT